MPASDDRVARLAEWLDTVEQATHTSMRPGKPGTASQRALAVLQRLAPGGGGASETLELGDTIGEGGMGIVRNGTQVALGRAVAIKTLRDDKRGDDATLHLLREAWVTGSLEHPNVVPVYDIGLDGDGRPMIVLKRIEGLDWLELMDDADTVRDRFGATDLLEWNLDILDQVMNAVRFAHSRGIVHRDLKPENVMIGEFGEVYVVDWGIAVSLRDDGSGRLPLATDAIDMAGTPCYMAPEMLGGGDPPLSEKTDIYLLGATLYEIIAGGPPHGAESALELFDQVKASSPTMPADAPAPLVEICRRAMDPDPDGRFERVEQLQLALRGYLRHRGAALLAEEAERRRRELEPLLTAGDAADRHVVYKLFGACRFGFQEAIRAWPQNERAIDGMRRAVASMVGYELAVGNPRAADALLADLDEPPPELRARVDDALRTAREEQAELERLRHDRDPRIGSRTRWFLAGVLGMIWTVSPLTEYRLGLMHRSHGTMALFTGGLMVLGLVAFLWARESLTKTEFNRRVSLAIAMVMICQQVLILGTWLIGLATVQTQVLLMFLWMVGAAMGAITIDRRIVTATLGYAIAFVVAARWQEARYFAMSAGNLVLMVNALIIWWPRRRDYPRGLFVR